MYINYSNMLPSRQILLIITPEACPKKYINNEDIYILHLNFMHTISKLFVGFIYSIKEH